MAVYIKAIPTLQGSTAERFVKISEDNLIKRRSVDFTKSAANSRAIIDKKIKDKVKLDIRKKTISKKHIL